MKITKKQLKNLIYESLDGSKRPFDHYYSNYSTDHPLALSMYKTFIVKGRQQPSPDLQELIDLARSRSADLESNGIVRDLGGYLKRDITFPVDRLTIHKMLKGELPMDYNFIQAKMDNADGFAKKMRTGKYGKLD